MLYGRDIDCNLLFWPGYYTNAEPSGPNDDQGHFVTFQQAAEYIGIFGEAGSPLF
jgi:hypothetical protein